MRRNLSLVLFVIAVILMSGCQSDMLVRVNTPPIVVQPSANVVVRSSSNVAVKPSPPVYRYQVDGFFSYDYRNHHIVYTKNRNKSRYYEPLSNARVIITATGREVRTDNNGYFHMHDVPRGRLTIKLVHSWVGRWDGEYFDVHSW
ncbi:MAG: hypothetical protein QM401_12155 [Bacillota bacterium]|nr:hypothetical protein [Bacillota bacterium]HHU62020.1 carboxypeptidase-like regulatory domain-containing protein [Natronincola sp.]